MKFVSRKVSEFADIHLGGTPSTSQAKYWNGDIPWITPKDMSRHDGIYISGGERYITDRGLQESSAQLLPADTVILSTRAPVGYVAVADGALATNQGCKNLQCKKGIAHPIFIYYLLKKSTALLEANATGSTYKELSTSRLKNIVFDLPESIADQIRIAEILSAYDNLIENNRRRITLLEQAAHLLYKEWFVKPCPHNTLPEGWEQKTLGEIDIARGRNITKNTTREGTVPVVAGGLTPSYYHDTANVAAPVITVSGSGANAGYVNLYHEDIWASDCSYITSAATKYIYFYYALLKSKQTEITALQKGAAQPHVYPKDLRRLQFIASEAAMRLFQDKVADNFSQIKTLLRQNQLLIKSRDMLLPRLMRGEMF